MGFDPKLQTPLSFLKINKWILALSIMFGRGTGGERAVDEPSRCPLCHQALPRTRDFLKPAGFYGLAVSDIFVQGIVSPI